MCVHVCSPGVRAEGMFEGLFHYRKMPAVYPVPKPPFLFLESQCHSRGPLGGSSSPQCFKHRWGKDLRVDVPRDSTLGKSELQVAGRTSTPGMLGIRVHHPLVGCTQAHLPAYPHSPGPSSRAVMSLSSSVQGPLLCPSLSLPSRAHLLG